MRNLMGRLIATIMFLALLLSNGGALAEALEKNNLSTEKLDAIITDYIQERVEGTAALSMGVFQNGQVLYKKHYGLIDVENQVKADDLSVYDWGSVSKALCWIFPSCSATATARKKSGPTFPNW